MSGRLVAVLAAAALVLSGCTAAAPTPTRTPTARPTGPVVLVALGDSMTVAANTCGRVGPCPRNSWATGTADDVDSVASRISATGRTVTTHNLAVVGRRIGELDDQVAALGRMQATVVTLQIGANDACASSAGGVTSAAGFAGRADRLLGEVADAAPDAVVYVAGVPDIVDLTQAIAADPRARAAWSRGHICPSALADPGSTDAGDTARRDALRDRIREYNAALVAACARVERCVSDDGDVFAYRFGKTQVSTLDYFHPSVAGQAMLARIAWTHLGPRLAS